MPRTGVSVLRNEPEFLDEWIAKVAEDRTRPSREERLIRRQHAASDDASAAVRARSGAAFRELSAAAARTRDGAAFRERNATTARPPSAPRPVRAPRTGDSAVRASAPAPARPRPAARTLEDPPERRTVTIRGQVADRYSPASRRRADVPRHARPGFQPDRVAMWAVLLGVILVLVAATSAHAAMLVR